jgi:hypothetical protein
MPKAESQALHRLIKRELAERLLKVFASGMPGIGLALVERDGSSYARAGDWQTGPPQVENEPASGALAAALAQASGVQPLLAAGLHLYPLLVEEQVLGALAATGPGSALPALQASLALIAGQALELRGMGRGPWTAAGDQPALPYR